MAKNKITDLRDHMFAQLERLGDESLSAEDLKTEIERAKAISEVGKVIVESVKTEVLHLKLVGKLHNQKPKFLNEDEENRKEQIQRPPAEYSNNGHLKAIGE